MTNDFSIFIVELENTEPFFAWVKSRGDQLFEFIFPLKFEMQEGQDDKADLKFTPVYDPRLVDGANPTLVAVNKLQSLIKPTHESVVAFHHAVNFIYRGITKEETEAAEAEAAKKSGDCGCNKQKADSTEEPKKEGDCGCNKQTKGKRKTRAKKSGDCGCNKRKSTATKEEPKKEGDCGCSKAKEDAPQTSPEAQHEAQEENLTPSPTAADEAPQTLSDGFTTSS